MTVVVTLLGGGPGDPDLLTLRAEAILASAAVVVVDRPLVALATTFAPRARLVAVGGDADGDVDGAAGDGAAELLRAVSRGGPVVRLYRGDPWLHPAHVAEAAALRRAGVSMEAVPGVAVEVAVPAQAGIPVHTRRLAVTATFATAGEAPTPVDPTRTLVVTAPDLRSTASRLAASRLAIGADATMPAAAVSARGVRRGTVDALAADAPSEPGLLACGAVCTPDTAAAVAR